MLRRIFVAFAPEDKSNRDWLVQHFASGHNRCEFIEVSAEKPWDAEWKARSREHIEICGGVIALISRNTFAARGARWQMECASERGKPILGVHVYADARGGIPSELAGCRVIEWTWAEIEAFLGGGLLDPQILPEATQRRNVPA